jgi:hypothetical protein
MSTLIAPCSGVPLRDFLESLHGFCATPAIPPRSGSVRQGRGLASLPVEGPSTPSPKAVRCIPLASPCIRFEPFAGLGPP